MLILYLSPCHHHSHFISFFGTEKNIPINKKKLLCIFPSTYLALYLCPPPGPALGRDSFWPQCAATATGLDNLLAWETKERFLGGKQKTTKLKTFASLLTQFWKTICHTIVNNLAICENHLSIGQYKCKDKYFDSFSLEKTFLKLESSRSCKGIKVKKEKQNVSSREHI